jgi:hypothetical protein
MREHVGDDELMDVVEGTASADVRRHVQACAACGARVAETSSALDLARDADVPEPSPLFWEAFRVQVGRKVGAERRSRLTGWAPALAAAAVAALGIGVLTQPHAPATPASTLPAWSASLPSGDESGLAQLPLPADADELSLACSGVADCVSGLSDEESLALADVLSQELGTGSDL